MLHVPVNKNSAEGRAFPCLQGNKDSVMVNLSWWYYMQFSYDTYFRAFF